MALRATLALFCAAVTLALSGPLALALTEAVLAGQAPGIDLLLGALPGGSPPLAALVFSVGTLGAAIGLTLLWLPVHALLAAARLTGRGMYFAAGYVLGGALAGAALGPWGMNASAPLVALLLGGATAGAATAMVFWFIRRPDWA